MNLTQVVLGIDIGGTNTVFGLIDEKGKYFLKDEISTEANLSADSLLNRLFYTFNKKYKAFQDKFEIIGIGLGAPSANYFKGTIENPKNLNWGYVNIIELVQKYYNLPIAVTNDANAAAIGEMKYGVAKNYKNFIEITLGTGLGSGLIIDGNLFYGQDGFAGEIGHTIVEENGRHCRCGRKGCLETYVSSTGIKRTVFELLSFYHDDSYLRDCSYNSLTSKTIYEFAIKGDKIANLAFEITGNKLGRALSNVVAHLNPEAIILFGGLALAGNLILNPVQYHFEENLLYLYKDKVKLHISQLMNYDNAAIMGAAAIMWHKIRTKNSSSFYPENFNAQMIK